MVTARSTEDGTDAGGLQDLLIVEDSLEASLDRIAELDGCCDQCRERWRKEEKVWWAKREGDAAAVSDSSQSRGFASAKSNQNNFFDGSWAEEDDPSIPTHRRLWLPPALLASLTRGTSGASKTSNGDDDTPSLAEKLNSQDFTVDVPKHTFTVCDLKRHSVSALKEELERKIEKAATAKAQSKPGVIPSPAASATSSASPALFSSPLSALFSQYEETPPSSSARLHESDEYAALGGLWLTAKGVVYNVQPFLRAHPGGINSLLKRSGQEADRDFDFHGEEAQRLWAKFAIGKLGPCSSKPGIRVVGGNGPHGGGGGGCIVS